MMSYKKNASHSFAQTPMASSGTFHASSTTRACGSPVRREQFHDVSGRAQRGIAASVLPGIVGGTHRLKRELSLDGLVSIIIPTCAAQGMIERCIETIRGHTRYRNFEIVCVENIPPAE